MIVQQAVEITLPDTSRSYTIGTPVASSRLSLPLDSGDFTSRIRSDYQIDTPQMRSKLESGNKADFSPYGKSPAQTLIRMVNAINRFE